MTSNLRRLLVYGQRFIGRHRLARLHFGGSVLLPSREGTGSMKRFFVHYGARAGGAARCIEQLSIRR